MELIFSVIAAVCAALALAVSLLVLKNQKNGHTSPQNVDTARLEHLLGQVHYIVEQNAHASRDYLDFMAKQQNGNLKASPKSWKRSTPRRSGGSPKFSGSWRARSST